MNKDGEDFLKGDDSLDELLMERFALAEERIAEICTEKENQRALWRIFFSENSRVSGKNRKNPEKRTGRAFSGRAESGKYGFV